MKILVPSLALLAGAALTPTLSAAHIEDQDLKLSLVLNLQPRLEVSNASNASGADYDVQAGATGESDTADFYLRRLRTGIKGSYQDHWTFAGIINADDAGRSNQATRNLTVHQAYVGFGFGESDITHLVQGGLDYAFFNHATASNGAALFPIQRASAELLPVRGLGIAYRLSAPIVRFGVDIQNLATTGATGFVGDDGVASTESEGLAYTARVEITGPGDLALGKFQESYLNKEGMGFIVGFEGGINQDDRNIGNTVSATTAVYGVDVLFHVEGLNALAEMRARNIKTEPDGGATTDVDARIFIVQAGYAFPASSVVLEPAVRYQLIDLNDGNDDETAPYGSKDYGTSGNQIDIGLNCYFNGHGNKLSLAYSMWEAEDGDADANIVRLQHQLNF